MLRYGLFYGHGASNGTLSAVRAGKFPVIGGGTGIWSFCEISDAAAATRAAVTRGAPGLYNIVDDEPAPAAEWVPFLARCLGAPDPREIPASLGRELAGEYLTAQMTVGRGSSNAKAKRELGCAPRYATWREGFAEWAKSVPAAAAAVHRVCAADPAGIPRAQRVVLSRRGAGRRLHACPGIHRMKRRY